MRHVALLGLSLGLSLAACNDKGAQKPVDTGGEAGETLPPPGDLQAGFARVRIPVPVGMGTVGYGPDGGIESESPYSVIYPSTRHVHGHPELKAAVISRGDAHEVVFVRLDAVGVFQQFRRAVVLEYEARTGRDIDDALVMGATHTHAGPGRIVDGGAIFDIIADRFFPDFYERYVGATVDVIEAAYADMAPASIATTMSSCVEAHDDRRCEDGGPDYTNGDIPLIVVERGGEVSMVIGAYAVHGTVLSLSDLTLSQDAYGPIEHAIEDGFGHPVDAMMFNSWGADMSPGNPEVDARDGVDQGDFDQMERIGVTVAEQVHQSIAVGLTWDEAPTVRVQTYRPPIDRQSIGYAEDEFTYEFGAVYCEGDGDCDASTTIPDLDTVCLPFNELFPAPDQTVVSSGRVGGFHLITFPGEPGTAISERVMAEVRAADSEVGDIFFLGYGQDYLGYSIEESDWWQGGYEASGALWGPRQGEYLAARVVEAAAAYRTGDRLAVEVAPIWTFDTGQYSPWEPEAAVGAGAVSADVAASYGRTETISFTVTGSDPWLGTPTARLLDADGAPVLRPNGVALSGDDYPFHWTLSVEPAYEAVAYPTERTFSWTVALPAGHRTGAWAQLGAGTYSLELAVPGAGGDTVLTSAPFNIVDAG